MPVSSARRTSSRAGERVEQRPHPGQQAAPAVPGCVDLLAQRGAVRLAERVDDRRPRDRQAGVGQRVAHDDAIGAAGQVDLLQRVLEAMGLGEGARHGARAGAAGQDQRPVDVEQQQSHVSLLRTTEGSGASRAST